MSYKKVRVMHTTSESLSRKQAELNSIAKEYSDQNLRKARERCNKEKSESQVSSGDLVFLRRNAREDSLVPRFDGPYQVLARSEADVKLRLSHRDKWVHLDHCKLYKGTTLTIPQTPIPQETESQDLMNQDGESQDPPDSCIQYECDGADTTDSTVIGDREELSTIPEGHGVETERKYYPRRERRPPQYLGDYVTWDETPRQNYSHPPTSKK